MTRAFIYCALATAGVILASCGPEPLAVSGVRGQTLAVVVGQELDITLGTVGPGEYLSPPTILYPAVRFLDAAIVPPILPSGPTQRFRFQAVLAGRAIVIFRHSGGDPTVIDTVNVR